MPNVDLCLTLLSRVMISTAREARVHIHARPFTSTPVFLCLFFSTVILLSLSDFVIFHLRLLSSNLLSESVDRNAGLTMQAVLVSFFGPGLLSYSVTRICTFQLTELGFVVISETPIYCCTICLLALKLCD